MAAITDIRGSSSTMDQENVSSKGEISLGNGEKKNVHILTPNSKKPEWSLVVLIIGLGISGMGCGYYIFYVVTAKISTLTSLSSIGCIFIGKCVTLGATSSIILLALKNVKKKPKFSLPESKNIVFNPELEKAVTEGDLQTLRKLLPQHTDQIKNASGLTLLHLAIFHDRFFIVDFLINENYVNVNVQDNSGKTPLHYAAFDNNVFSICVLKNHKADLSIKDADGHTPYDLATLEQAKLALIAS